MATTYEEVLDLMRALIASQQETDRKFQETDRKFQETNLAWRERAEATERLLKQQSQETDRQFRETDRKIKEVSTQIGKLGNRLGDFVEEMVRPALVRLFQARGMEVHHALRNHTAYDANNRVVAEVDLIVSNTTEAVVVECKSNLSMDDVNDYLKRLGTFKTYFPRYQSMHISGALAAMVIADNVGQYAMRKGLYLLAQSGDAIIIANDPGFVPTQW